MQMQKLTLPKLKHKKLIILLGVGGLLVVGYFVYKYTYIYVERRKYDQAAVAIQKVAADLRAQGIETEFSRGCANNIEVYGAGSLACSIGLNYEGHNTASNSAATLDHFVSSVSKEGFTIVRNGIKVSPIGAIPGIAIYKSPSFELICTLQVDSKDADYFILFDCSDSAKFNIF